VTDDSCACMASFPMDGRRELHITFSDRLDNGIVVGFDDGKTAFFPAALLHATLPQAQMMPSDSEDRYLPKEGDVSP
jgi:hypothetical protein